MFCSSYILRRIALVVTVLAMASLAAFTAAVVANSAPSGTTLLAATTGCTQYTKTSYGRTVPVTQADVTHGQTAVVALVNTERKQRGLRTLCLSPTIRTAAAAHAQNWRGADRSCPASANWFGCAHWDSRAGLAWPQDRLAASGYGPCANNCIGKNTYNGGGRSDGTHEVLAGMDNASPEAAVYWWMNHNGGVNGHRDAILRADFTFVGVGVATYTDTFGNRAAAYVLDFGKR